MTIVYFSITIVCWKRCLIENFPKFQTELNGIFSVKKRRVPILLIDMVYFYQSNNENN